MYRFQRAVLVPILLPCILLTACSTEPQPAQQSPGSAPATESAGSSAPGSSASAPTAPTPTPTPTPTPEALELPRGGTELFPDYRLVGFSGHPHSPALGRLGVGNIDERVAEIETMATRYAGKRQVQPVLELITVVVQDSPGADGMYRTRVSDEIIGNYLETARKHDALLLLNVQPGRSSMTEEVGKLEKWLKEPDVGLALDPEWDVEPGQIPGATYGHTDGAEIDAIAAYLNEVVAQSKLPQKALVYHQVANAVVTNAAAIQERPGVAVVQSVDGIGAPRSKIETYNSLMAEKPPSVHAGFKLFFAEDAATGPIMTPAEVLALTPQPEYVLYE